MGSMNVISHNLPGMFSQRQLGITTKDKSKSTEKLSSGFKINRAADDASGLAISEKMRLQIRALKQGLDNTVDGISFVQIADGAMSEAQDIVHRISELAIKAANGTNSDSDRKAINKEVQALKTELDRIHETTKFNEEYVFTDKLPALPSLHLKGSYFAKEDINIFNSAYDAETGKVTYGGFMLNGQRYSWDDIDPDMVSVDASGNQIFHGGRYSFSQNGQYYVLECDRDSSVPNLYHKVDFEGFPNQIYIGTSRYSIYDFQDDTGVSFNWMSAKNGTYSLKSDPSVRIDLNLFFDSVQTGMWGDPMEAVAREFQQGAVSAEWTERWADSVDKKAVESYSDKQVNIDSRSEMQRVLNQLNGGSVLYRSRAGKEDRGTPLMENATQDDPNASEDYSKNGIWLERQIQVDAVDANGNPTGQKVTKWAMVENSLQTWEDVGLKDDTDDFWKSGTDVRDAVTAPVTYSYVDESPKSGADTTVVFSFQLLSDVTSLDSVIDGIDKASVYSTSPVTNYSANMTTSGSSNVTGSSFSTRGTIVNVKEEYELFRDYGNITVSDVAAGTGSVSGDTATFNMGNSHASYAYKANISSTRNQMANNMLSYANAVESRKKALALSGQDPQSGSLGLSYTTTSTSQMTFTHPTDSSRTMTMTYNYNYADLKDSIIVQMNGYTGDADAYLGLPASQRPVLYDRQPDGSYQQYNYNPIDIDPNYGTPSAMTDADFRTALSAKLGTLYTLDVTYTDPSDPSVQLSNSGTLRTQYAQKALTEMLGSSTVHFNATDYTKFAWHTNEQPNVSKDSRFFAEIDITGKGHGAEYIRIQHSGEVPDCTHIPKVCMNTYVLGLSFADCSTVEDALITIDKANGALNAISYRRSKYGAIQNRLEHTLKNRNNVMENTQAAESRIRDTDMAEEMVRYSNTNIIQQAGQSMLTQANQERQNILSLLK